MTHCAGDHGAALYKTEDKLPERMAPHMQRVLILDPVPAAVNMLTNLLRDINRGQVWSAPTPERAMTLAKSVSPQIIFVEQSSLIDGIGFTRALRRSTYGCRQAAVIMVTAEATAAVIIAARDAGVHEFLRKPYTIKDLVRRLEAVTLRQRDWIEAVGYVGPDRRRFNSGDYAGTLRRRTDTAPLGDAERLLQALKIMKSAVAAMETDRDQALRSLRAQIDVCQSCALGLSDLDLAAATSEAARYLGQVSAGNLDRLALDRHMAGLLTFLPADTAPGGSIAA